MIQLDFICMFLTSMCTYNFCKQISLKCFIEKLKSGEVLVTIIKKSGRIEVISV